MQAVKRISAQHRLILSGTPIQNSVLELWTLFDFLMPGFLGTHAAFNARYGRALAASKGSKTGSPEAQAGLLAMEGLHKQVGLPLPGKAAYVPLFNCWQRSKIFHCKNGSSTSEMEVAGHVPGALVLAVVGAMLGV